MVAFFVQVSSATDFTVLNRFGAGLSQGVAWGDYNGDGKPDLLVAVCGRSRLYRNDGNNNFTLVDSSFQTVSPYGVAWADYDNDGRLDFAIGDFAGVLVYKNTETGFKLTDLAGGPVRAVAWGDYNNDGNLDLAVANYGQPNQLFRNDGAGNFIPVPNAFGSAYDSTNSVTWVDYNNDGWLDLVAVNYKGVVKLFKNNKGSFTEQQPPFDPTAQNGFGVAAGDYDNDGGLDLLITNYGDTSHLYHNIGGVLTNVSGIFSDQENSTGCAWGDFNNDGYLDFAIANCGSRNELFLNNGSGGFSQLPSFVPPTESSFCLAVSDCDNDGDLDLAVASHGQNRLYQNNGSNNQYIKVTLVGRGAGYTNRSGIGARVYLYNSGTNNLVGFRELTSGSGFSAMNDLEAFFGVAPGSYDLVVRWPSSGYVDSVKSVSPPAVLTIVEDQTSPLNPDTVWSTTHTPAVWSKDQNITMVWSGASDLLGSGIAGYACGFDTIESGTPPDTVTVHYPDATFSTILNYDSGNWYFHIRAIDKVGNWARGFVSSGPFAIDKTPPQTPQLIFPANGEKTNRANPVLKWHPASDLSGVSKYEVKIATDPSFDPSYIELDSTTAGDTTIKYMLMPGQHFWKVQAFDKLNNASPWSSTNLFTIDTVPPAVLVTSPQNGDTGIGLTTQIIVTFKDNDIDSTSVTPTTFTVTGNSSGSYPASRGSPYFSGGNYICDPLRNFKPHETITCLLTTGIKDSAGNRLPSNYSWQFTTTGPQGGDTIGPITSQVTAQPDTTYGASYFILRAKISDVNTGGNKILQAEYFMDVIGNDGYGIPMLGDWGSKEIIVFDTVFTALIDTGFHTFFVHGMDASSNWGRRYDSVVVWITNSPPTPQLSIKTDKDTINIGDTLIISVSSTKPLEQFQLTVLTSNGSKINPDFTRPDSLHYQSVFVATGVSSGNAKIIASGIDHSGNNAADTVFFSIRNPGKLLPRNRVYAWPNPLGSDIGHFRYFVTQNADVKLSIYTLTGKLILSRTQIDAVAGYANNEFTINLSQSPNDIYLFKIEAKTKDGSGYESVVKKFAIAK